MKLILGVPKIGVTRLRLGRRRHQLDRILPAEIRFLAIGEIEREIGRMAQRHEGATIVENNRRGKLAGPAHAPILTDIVGGREQPVEGRPMPVDLPVSLSQAERRGVALIMISGEQTKAARALLGWTKVRLAARSNQTEKAVALFEASERRPNERKVAEIVTALEVAGGEFPEGEPPRLKSGAPFAPF